jgi:predicted DNA-binding ribbon-helix-helix protein
MRLAGRFNTDASGGAPGQDLRPDGLGELIGGAMKSLVIKRSIVVGGHKTSVSLEEAFWKGVKEIASNRNLTLSELVSTIDSGRLHGNLSSAIRLFVLDHYRTTGMPSSSIGRAAQGSTAIPSAGC